MVQVARLGDTPSPTHPRAVEARFHGASPPFGDASRTAARHSGELEVRKVDALPGPASQGVHTGGAAPLPALEPSSPKLSFAFSLLLLPNLLGGVVRKMTSRVIIFCCARVFVLLASLALLIVPILFFSASSDSGSCDYAWDVRTFPVFDERETDFPNFIILNTGQSNSIGYGAAANSSAPEDKPNEQIFGWNSGALSWEKADLFTESLGWARQPGWQLASYHFARRLAYIHPSIRPGIISHGIGDQPISQWAKYERDEIFFSMNDARPGNQGSIFDFHVSMIVLALNALPRNKRRVDVVFYHQGERDYDADMDYFANAVLRVVAQYRGLNYSNSNSLVFLAGEVAPLPEQLAINQALKASLDGDSDEKTRIVQMADLPVQDDLIHFASTAHRIAGFERYYEELIKALEPCHPLRQLGFV